MPTSNRKERRQKALIHQGRDAQRYVQRAEELEEKLSALGSLHQETLSGLAEAKAKLAEQERIILKLEEVFQRSEVGKEMAIDALKTTSEALGRQNKRVAELEKQLADILAEDRDAKKLRARLHKANENLAYRNTIISRLQKKLRDLEPTVIQP